MISKAILDQVKSFLCFDQYPDLTVKLISIDTAVAFFYPPTKDLSTIIVFYEKNSNDFSAALFLLFHEVGHFKQFRTYQTQNRISEFWSLINLDKGIKKIKFEREAWDKGKKVMEEFLVKYQSYDSTLVNQFQAFAEKCLLSYKQ